MTQEEYLALERLLGKLKIELGNRYLILPDHIQDGFHIQLYYDSGNIIKDKCASEVSIERCVNKIKNLL